MYICLSLTIILTLLISINSFFISNLFGLNDKSHNNDRKIHLKDTPNIGGVIILSTLTVIYFWQLIFVDFKKEILANYLLCFSFFLVGFFDDKLDIKPLTRIILYSIFIYIAININQNLIIDKIYFETFDRFFYLQNLSIIFTILCFLLLQNSLNMFDGINGLLILFTIKILAVIVYYNLTLTNLIIIINLIILFYFNIKTKYFLGNNGSSIISAIIAISLIETNKLENIVFSSEIIFILLIIPGLDMLRLFIVRILNKQNPFEGDKKHLHHYLARKFTHINSTLIIVGSSLSVMILSFLITKFLLILLFILLYILFSSKFLRL
tara:strand:- start:831 stop:1802 length:972 start_codon:yes stop_codon:yes gene_type:complete